MKTNNVISPVLDALIKALRCLPGVGPKSAQRMAYHLLQQQRTQCLELSQAMSHALNVLKDCEQCNMLTESTLCPVCQDESRDASSLCVVASPSDILAIEQASIFKGRYYVLKGLLSPLDGIGPEQLALNKLFDLLKKNEVKEVILALSHTTEGQATIFYLSTQLAALNLKITQLAQGIPMGGELEYMNIQTISNALKERASV